MVDLGVGSGAITIALVSERADWHCIGVDVSKGALRVASKNSKRLLSKGGCSLVASNWLDAIAQGSVDLVVSNPPYIEGNDPHLDVGDLRFEPRSALVSERNGLDDIRAICQQAKVSLVSGGYLIVEHGWQQQPQVVELFRDNGFVNIEQGRDLAGQPRYVLARCI